VIAYTVEESLSGLWEVWLTQDGERPHSVACRRSHNAAVELALELARLAMDSFQSVEVYDGSKKILEFSPG